MDILEQMKRTGVPPQMINDALLEKVASPFESKFIALTNMVKEKPEFKVFLVHGEDSPQKDQFCAAFMKWYMLQFNKTGRWYGVCTQFEDTFGDAGVSVIPATYLLNPVAARIVSGAIREKLPLGRAFVLCSNDRDTFDGTFGKDFITFVSHQSLSIEVSVPRASIMVI